MTTFALITEGLTDQIILENIIYECCGDDDIYVNPLQPARDATDESRIGKFGGWELVLEYCGFKEKVLLALSSNDFIVIQIDTDCGDHANFGLNLCEGGVDKGVDRLVTDTTAIIIRHLGAELFDENRNRFLFAVAVHSLESWILLIAYGEDRIKNCFEHLRRHAHKVDKFAIKKEADCYEKLARKITRKGLRAAVKVEGSLNSFVAQLEDRNVLSL